MTTDGLICLALFLYFMWVTADNVDCRSAMEVMDE